MSSDRITAAIDLVLEELVTAIDEINLQYEKFTQEGEYDNAQHLIESGKQLQRFKEKVNGLRLDWANGLDNATRVRVKVKSIRGLASHHKGPKTGLLVRLQNGKIIHESVAADTFALALQEFGFDHVRSLNKFINGVPLISTTRHDSYNQRRLGSYYVMTHSNTKSKKETLESVAKELGVKISVDIIR